MSQLMDQVGQQQPAGNAPRPVQQQIQNIYGSIDWTSILGSMNFELTAEQIEALTQTI